MIRWHVLPNVVAPLVVFATFAVASVVIFEASLSYLGLGVQQPTPSWGNMLNARQLGDGPSSAIRGSGCRRQPASS